MTDDLDGTEGAKTYQFAWQDATYEIDLTDAHRDELRRAHPHRGARGISQPLSDAGSHTSSSWCSFARTSRRRDAIGTGRPRVVR
ncbi:Lsr2 dimerization domain-containing protein [Cellulosimicrobium sp. Marseille-Q8652]